MAGPGAPGGNTRSAGAATGPDQQVPAGSALFWVPQLPPPGGFVLGGAEGRHAATVRRLRVGEALVLTDGAGSWAPATVREAGRGELTLEVAATVAEPARSPRVTVVQALPKGERSELAVELATEAGADAIVPWAAERCVARWSGDKATAGVQRWQQIAREAGKQARRTRFPEVSELLTTGAVAGLLNHAVAAGGVALVLHEAAGAGIQQLKPLLARATEIVLIVGPEGGISPAEVAVLSAAGARPVRLGPDVLRTSTAAAVALGALGVLTGRWR